MGILSSLRLIVHFHFRRTRVEHEMEEELRSHLRRRVDDLQRQGLFREDAERQARIEFGGYQTYKEECREALGTRLLEELTADLRHGLRQLRRNPGFTAVAVLTLALGIGANSAIFSAIDAVMLKFLPVAHPEQLVLLRWQSPHEATDYLPYPMFEQFRKRNQVFTGLVAFHSVDLATRVDRQQGLAAGQLISGDYFSVLGVKPLLGRTFTAEDDRIPGADPLAVISYRYWEDQFARSPTVLGRSIQLNGTPFTIIGVMPRTFFGVSAGDSRDVWIPLMMQAEVMGGRSVLNDRNSWWLHVMARRKPGSEQQALAALNLLYQRYAHPEAGSRLSAQADRELRDERIALQPAGRGLSTLRDRLSKPLIVLMALVGLVLFVACANIASLVLARAIVRGRELAVRAALGAGQLRLLRQLLTESLLLAILGGVVSLLFARWGESLLQALLSDAGTPVSLDVRLNPAVLIFTACVALLAGLLFGTIPAWQAARVDPGSMMKATVHGSALASGTLRSHWELRRLLVIGEVAMALLLVVGAGLLVRSLQKLKDVDPGFDQNGVLLVSLDPTLVGYRGNRLTSFYKQVTAAVQALPGIRSVALSALPPMTDAQWRSSVFVQGHIPGPHERTTTDLNFVGPRYFHTLGVPLMQGREFTLQDSAQAPKVAIINEAMARYYFGNQWAIGKRLSFIDPEHGEIVVVGVARSSKYNNLRETVPHMTYLPYLQTPAASLAYSMTLEVRTAGNPDAAVGTVRQAIRQIDSKVPVLGLTTLAEQVSESLAQQRMVARISTVFGLVALLLACIGLYGVMTYTVARRTGEIGIRMALGAQRAQVLWIVLREALGLAAIGITIGVPLAIVFARLISTQLYGISPADPLTIVGSIILLSGIALMASYLPARRATRIHPMAALRQE
jgi:predicted permease